MDRVTFETSIRSYKAREPFHPFTVSLLNGSRVEIDHPDAILAREGVALYVAPGGIPHVFDLEGVCEIIGDLAEQSPE